jgi:hypothetical protein
MDPDQDEDPDPVIFVSDLKDQDVNNKIIICLLLLDGPFASFFKDKK